MAITLTNAWKTGTAIFTTTANAVLDSIPSAGDLLVCCAATLTSTNTITVSDSIGDGVSWSTAIGPTTLGAVGAMYIFYKQVGTPSGGGKTVTATVSNADFMPIGVGGYSGGPTPWTLDGSPTSSSNASSANPAPGAIVTTSAGPLVIGFANTANNGLTPGSGYNFKATVSLFGDGQVEDRIASSSGSYNPNWTASSDAWIAQGAAWRSEAAAGGKVPWPLLRQAVH